MACHCTFELWVTCWAVSARWDGASLEEKVGLLPEACAAKVMPSRIHALCVEYTSRCAEVMIAPWGMPRLAKRSPV